MKTKTKLLLALALSSAAFACAACGCSKNDTSAAETEQPYEYVFNKPFAGTPDEDMKIDGILNESAWQNKTYLEQSVKGKQWAATTHFTAKGVYIAVKATDPNMVYRTRYTDRSAFSVYLCKTGTQTYGINDLTYSAARYFEFQLDPYYCRSKSRVPYYYKAHVEGELNGDSECTLTAELFLTWKDLYYTEEELGKNGYPEDIQMYASYGGEPNEVLGSCLWREETFFLYGKDGYKGEIQDENFGSVKNGLASTDRWAKNENGNLYTTAGRTQIIWLKNAYAKDFMFEATLKPLDKKSDGSDITLRGDKVYGRFGLIHENSNADYSVYSSTASGAPARIQLQTCRQIDSFHWQNKIGVSGGNISTGISEDFVTFRVIKQGDMFYYFYGDTYWKSERIQDLQDKVYSGVYTTQGVEILDYKYENLEGKEAELKAELSKYMYFVSVPGASTYGSVTGSAYAVPKGETVTVSFVPASRGLLTEVMQNGEDKYDEITAAMNDECEYTFMPTGDVTFTATFKAFDSKDLVKTVIAYKDTAGNLVKDGSYKIYGSEKRLFYKGTPNDSGYVIVYIPKEGTYHVGGRTIETNGNYRLVTTFSGYHDSEAEFTLNDTVTSTDINGKEESVATTKSFTKQITLLADDWGTVRVNGVSVGGYGTLNYNEATGNYYAENEGLLRYFKNTVQTDFAAEIKIDVTNIGHSNNDLAGVAITNGRYVLIFKTNLENPGAILVATGNGTEDSVAGREIAVAGFNWKNITLPNGGANGKGTFAFKIIKSGNAVYLLTERGELRAYFNENGVNLVNGAFVVWGGNMLESVNADLKKMFSAYEEAVIGARTYSWSGLRAEYTLNFSTEAQKIKIGEIDYGTFGVSLAKGASLSDKYPLKSGYAVGETTSVGMKISNPRKTKAQMIVTDKFGTRVIEGTYDYSYNCIVFKVAFRGGNTKAVINIVRGGGVEWGDSWGDFSPDRDNTLID